MANPTIDSVIAIDGDCDNDKNDDQEDQDDNDENDDDDDEDEENDDEFIRHDSFVSVVPLTQSRPNQPFQSEQTATAVKIIRNTKHIKFKKPSIPQNLNERHERWYKRCFVMSCIYGSGGGGRNGSDRSSNNRKMNNNIDYLDYSHCGLIDVPIDIFQYERTLEELNLSSNHIVTLPRQLFHCVELKELKLNENKIMEIPPGIGSLIQLKELDLSQNSIQTISMELKGCKRLLALHLNGNSILRIPDVITKLFGLVELYLNDTALEFLPANFGRLINLRILELRDNHLQTLPKSMARLTQLTRIDIGHNYFVELPEVIGQLTELNELLIDGNQIHRICSNIGNLKKLIYFEARHNYLRRLPKEIGELCNLEVFSVSGNELTRIPVRIGHLHSLLTLKLDENQLRRLPNSICRMHRLEELMLSHNELRRLPHTIGLLRALRMLTVDDNRLMHLPTELCSCIRLTVFSARGNRIRSLPANIGHLSNLRVLNMVNNRLHSLPISLLNLTNLAALWISNNQSKPLVPLQTCSIHFYCIDKRKNIETTANDRNHLNWKPNTEDRRNWKDNRRLPTRTQLTCYMLPQTRYRRMPSLASSVNTTVTNSVVAMNGPTTNTNGITSSASAAGDTSSSSSSAKRAVIKRQTGSFHGINGVISGGHGNRTSDGQSISNGINLTVNPLTEIRQRRNSNVFYEVDEQNYVTDEEFNSDSAEDSETADDDSTSSSSTIKNASGEADDSEDDEVRGYRKKKRIPTNDNHYNYGYRPNLNRAMIANNDNDSELEDDVFLPSSTATAATIERVTEAAATTSIDSSTENSLITISAALISSSAAVVEIPKSIIPVDQKQNTIEKRSQTIGNIINVPKIEIIATSATKSSATKSTLKSLAFASKSSAFASTSTSSLLSPISSTSSSSAAGGKKIPYYPTVAGNKGFTGYNIVNHQVPFTQSSKLSSEAHGLRVNLTAKGNTRCEIIKNENKLLPVSTYLSVDSLHFNNSCAMQSNQISIPYRFKPKIIALKLKIPTVTTSNILTIIPKVTTATTTTKDKSISTIGDKSNGNELKTPTTITTTTATMPGILNAANALKQSPSHRPNNNNYNNDSKDNHNSTNKESTVGRANTGAIHKDWVSLPIRSSAASNTEMSIASASTATSEIGPINGNYHVINGKQFPCGNSCLINSDGTCAISYGRDLNKKVHPSTEIITTAMVHDNEIPKAKNCKRKPSYQRSVKFDVANLPSNYYRLENDDDLSKYQYNTPYENPYWIEVNPQYEVYGILFKNRGILFNWQHLHQTNRQQLEFVRKQLPWNLRGSQLINVGKVLNLILRNEICRITEPEYQCLMAFFNGNIFIKFNDDGKQLLISMYDFRMGISVWQTVGGDNSMIINTCLMEELEAAAAAATDFPSSLDALNEQQDNSWTAFENTFRILSEPMCTIMSPKRPININRYQMICYHLAKDENRHINEIIYMNINGYDICYNDAHVGAVGGPYYSTDVLLNADIVHVETPPKLPPKKYTSHLQRIRNELPQSQPLPLPSFEYPQKKLEINLNEYKRNPKKTLQKQNNFYWEKSSSSMRPHEQPPPIPPKRSDIATTVRLSARSAAIAGTVEYLPKDINNGDGYDEDDGEDEVYEFVFCKPKAKAKCHASSEKSQIINDDRIVAVPDDDEGDGPTTSNDEQQKPYRKLPSKYDRMNLVVTNFIPKRSIADPTDIEIENDPQRIQLQLELKDTTIGSDRNNNNLPRGRQNWFKYFSFIFCFNVNSNRGGGRDGFGFCNGCCTRSPSSSSSQNHLASFENELYFMNDDNINTSGSTSTPSPAESTSAPASENNDKLTNQSQSNRIDNEENNGHNEIVENQSATTTPTTTTTTTPPPIAIPTPTTTTTTTSNENELVLNYQQVNGNNLFWWQSILKYLGCRSKKGPGESGTVTFRTGGGASPATAYSAAYLNGTSRNGGVTTSIVTPQRAPLRNPMIAAVASGSGRSRHNHRDHRSPLSTSRTTATPTQQVTEQPKKINKKYKHLEGLIGNGNQRRPAGINHYVSTIIGRNRNVVNPVSSAFHYGRSGRRAIPTSSSSSTTSTLTTATAVRTAVTELLSSSTWSSSSSVTLPLRNIYRNRKPEDRRSAIFTELTFNPVEDNASDTERQSPPIVSSLATHEGHPQQLAVATEVTVKASVIADLITSQY